MSDSSVPCAFIRDQNFLTWRDVFWGYERQLIDWHCVVKLAEDRLSRGSGDEMEIKLAWIEATDVLEVKNLLHNLAISEPIENAVSSDKKWLFINLEWLFQNMARSADPLGEVERIYADFEYPSEVEPFVRYMPPTDGYDPNQHSLEENMSRLISKWQQYLLEARRVLQS